MIIFIVIAVVFHLLLSADFVSWDDWQTIAQNPRLNPVTWEEVGYYWAHSYMDLYVPVTYMFWGFLAAIGRTGAADPNGIWLNPAVFHGANLLLHVGSSVIVYKILRMLAALPATALFGALLFAIHPVQVEAVGWISGGKDVLAGLLSLACVWQYLEWSEKGWKWHYAFALGLYAIGMLAKPAAVVTPLVIAGIEIWARGKSWRKVTRGLWFWIVIAVPVVVVARLAQPTPETFVTPLLGRPVVMMDALAMYMGKLIWPAQLGIDYGRAPEWVLGSTDKYFTCAATAMVVAIAWAMRKRWREIVAGALVFVIMLLPVLGLVKFDFQRYSTVADHYLYAAMLGPAMAGAFALERIKSRWMLCVAGLVITALGIKAFVQTENWRDSRTLFSHALEVNPTSLAGNDGLGNMALHTGDIPEAIARFEEAVRGHPHDPIANFNLANALLLAGRYSEAAASYRWALEGRQYPFLYVNYANALARSGRLKEAFQVAEEGLRQWPESSELHATLGALEESRGNWTEAEEEYADALRNQPSLEAARTGIDRVRRAATKSAAH
ncbi:MAG TPA: tetratricopeptide repeat protein [Tepidisphaeraceae bacterium]|nr:tetratricopeptide repeat protein [Tepidisphaeraceae bacterium]